MKVHFNKIVKTYDKKSEKNLYANQYENGSYTYNFRSSTVLNKML